MIIKQLTLATLDTGTLDFGFVGENEHIGFSIKCDSVFDEYPTATASLLIKAPDNTIYPKTVEVEGYNVGWVITASDTAYPGSGQIQLTFTEDGAVVKTVIANTNVKDSLVGDDPPPDPIADWISTANQILGKVDGMTATAESLPSGDDPSVTVETVDGHYNLEFGIPAGDPGDPTEIIDDNAGVGDVTKVWSANKSATELSELKSDIDSKAPVIFRDASGDIVTVTDGADGMPLKECVVSVTAVQEGEGDPSPTNVRAITGVTASKITRTGKNLLGGTAFVNAVVDAIPAANVNTTDKYVSFTNGNNARKYLADSTLGADTAFYFPFKESTQYSFILTGYNSNDTSASANLRVYYTDGTYTGLGFGTDATQKNRNVIVTTAGKTVASIRKINSTGTGYFYYDECGIFEGVLTAADFKPYQGATYSVTFPTEAGSVYGGEVDMKAEKLTVIALATDMGDLSWTYNSDGTYPFFYAPLPAPARRRATGTYGVSLCEIYKPIPNVTGAGFASEDHDHEICINSGYAGGYRVIVQDASYTDADTFAAAVSGKLLVAPLASGVEYDLTDLPSITVLKESNIWSDTGAVALTYPADTKTYVDDRTPVQDVQINGASILSDGVANVPIASSSAFGVVKSASYGVNVNSSGQLYIQQASTNSEIKPGAANYLPIVPSTQHASAFYGLAKAAGDSTQSASSNAVGTYTDAAKVAIQKMLGVYQAPWELIREDTFTNATEADHIITVDGNGNAFELTDVVMMFETPNQATESSKGYYGNIQYLHGSSVVFSETGGTWTQAANANAHGFTQFITRKDGLVFKSGSVNAQTGGQGQERIIYAEGFPNSSAYNGVVPATGDNTVTSINIKAVLGTGHYKLYGKRKWN